MSLYIYTCALPDSSLFCYIPLIKLAPDKVHQHMVRSMPWKESPMVSLQHMQSALNRNYKNKLTLICTVSFSVENLPNKDLRGLSFL